MSSSGSLFRRKPTQSLPLFVNQEGEKPKSIKSFNSSKVGCLVLTLLGIVLYLVYGSFSIFPSYSSSNSSNILLVDPGGDVEHEIQSMDEIVKRHPYPLKEPFEGPNTRRSLLSEKTKGANINVLNEGRTGNVIFLSFHGRVANNIIMDSISENLDLFNAGDLQLFKKLTHNESQQERWDSFSPSELSDRNKGEITKYITESFSHYGTPLQSRMLLSVHMTDAWEVGVDITWLLSELMRVCDVTHVVMTSRNPIRAKISG
jgi:hypothetical protein